MEEFSLIHKMRSCCPELGKGIAIGNGDDAAVFSLPEGRETVVCTDCLAENVHFTRAWSTLFDIGWKAVAVNFSDLAAMGAEPYGVLLSVAVPQDITEEEIESLYRGVGSCLEKYDAVLLGGDTIGVAAGLFLAVTAVGAIEKGRALPRSGAEIGDRVVITGALGDAAAAWSLWQEGRDVPEQMAAAHLRPEPAVDAGYRLVELGAHAANDISDGLASELGEIATASQKRICVDKERLYRPDLEIYANDASQVWEWILCGGEDYQLLATLPPDAGVPSEWQVIGEVQDGQGVYLRDEQGKEVLLEPGGYNHFQRR